MNTDFAKLLNNCLNRVDGTDNDTDKNDDGRDTISEKVEIFGTNSSPVRSEIKDIIEEKIKQKDTNVGSPVHEKVGPIQLGGSDYEVELEEASGQATPEKAKILFSLKDFFERSKEPENNADSLSSDEDQESDDASSDLDKNIDSLYNDEVQSPDGDTGDDDISDHSDDSDLETVEDSKSDNESDIEDKKGDEPDHDSDLESELNLLEKLKQKLDDSITGNPKDLDQDDSVVIVDKANKEKIKDVMKSDDESDNRKDELCTEKKDKLCEGSDNDPIKINDDVAPTDTHEQKPKKDNQVKSMFKNISISLVGANSKTIDLESLLKKPSTTRSTSPPKQPPNVFHKPNISVKRKTVKSPESPVLRGKRFKKSSIILSSDEDSPRKKSVPTVTLDENTTIEDISDDEKEDKPKENVSSQYDNCTHGDTMDYMCVECTYNRWRCEWVFVKPVRGKKIKMAEIVEVNPVDIIQAVNWEKVFKFAGVGVK